MELKHTTRSNCFLPLLTKVRCVSVKIVNDNARLLLFNAITANPRLNEIYHPLAVWRSL